MRSRRKNRLIRPGFQFRLSASFLGLALLGQLLQLLVGGQAGQAPQLAAQPQAASPSPAPAQRVDVSPLAAELGL